MLKKKKKTEPRLGIKLDSPCGTSCLRVAMCINFNMPVKLYGKKLG